MPKTISRQAASNAECLIDFLAESGSATMADILRERLMSAEEASDTLRYCIRHGVVVREKRNGSAPSERVAYLLTGTPLEINDTPRFSFEALLSAWGLPDAAPPFTGDASMSRLVIQGCSL